MHTTFSDIVSPRPGDDVYHHLVKDVRGGKKDFHVSLKLKAIRKLIDYIQNQIVLTG